MKREEKKNDKRWGYIVCGDTDKQQISTKECIYPTVSIRSLSPMPVWPGVCMSVWELLLEGLCVISFRQETGNGVEAITLGESPRAPRNEGQGPVSTHGCARVYACAGSSRWPSFNERPMIYLLCPYPTSPCANTHMHAGNHMISSISVIR